MSAVLELWRPPEIRTLRDLSDALASAEDVETAASGAGAWVRAVVPDASVRLWQADAAGSLRVVWPTDAHEGPAELRHSEERWTAFEAFRSTRVRLGADADGVLAMFPLSCRGQAIGVLEVLAAESRIESTWDALEIVARQLGMALHGIALQDQLGHRARPSNGASAALLPEAAPDGSPSDEELDLTIAWTAHELRGPLVALKAALGILSEDGRPSSHDALLDRCRAEVDRLSTLVTDTLRWGVSGEAPRRRHCDLVHVVKDTIEQCRLELGVDRVTLDAPERVLACIDSGQLRSAIANLVRNALMYSTPDSRVEVIVNVDLDFVIVSVRNAGREILSEDQRAIFLPYVRGSNAGGRFGKGLGLFIARRIARANRGQLSVVSKDGMTEFRLEIPRGDR